jgi:PDZ domain-containing protein
VLVGAIVIALLGGGVVMAPVPYVVLEPGPTVDTLGERDGVPVIEIDGVDTAASTGELRLTTVAVQPDISLLDAIRAWFDGEEAVVPEEMFYPPGESREEVEQRNTEQFSRSQSAAETAAMRELGYPVRVSVGEVVEDGPADGVLQAGDLITEVNGAEVSELADLQQAISAEPVGATLTVDYTREGEPGTGEVTTVADQEDPDTPRVGIVAALVVDHPYELSIGLEDIGGPSAGLMFALGIIDKLEPADLTGGEIIAGTGSINADGTVGAIGGIPQKLVAARDAGATTFLVPAANCQEAVSTAPSGMLLIEVETLAGALDELAALRSEADPATCG